MTKVPLSELARVLPSLAKSHHSAMTIAARRSAPESIRKAHSTGITKFLSHLLRRPVPDPSYAYATRLHLVQGGAENGDKEFLERVARGTRRSRTWVVPKSATIGDEVAIYIGGYGLFATAQVSSRTKPRGDWKNRYGASLNAIELIEPPISLAAIQRHVPDLKWLRYPRSIATLSSELADQIRDLVKRRRETGMPDLDDAALASANIDELRKVALLRPPRSAKPKQRKVIVRARSRAIRRYVLCRANGHCESCMTPAPFLGVDGKPFLEAHHPRRRADRGPDQIWNIIALCPNCHRRTECSKDAKSFNVSLISRLTKLEPVSKKV
jgi:hypothetical protein